MQNYGIVLNRRKMSCNVKVCLSLSLIFYVYGCLSQRVNLNVVKGEGNMTQLRKSILLLENHRSNKIFGIF